MDPPSEFGSSSNNANSTTQVVTPFTRVPHVAWDKADKAYFCAILLSVQKVFKGI